MDESLVNENRQNFEKCLSELLHSKSPAFKHLKTFHDSREKFFLQSFSSDNDENETLNSSTSSLSLNDDEDANLTLTTLATTSPSIKMSLNHIRMNNTSTKCNTIKTRKKKNNQYYSTL